MNNKKFEYKNIIDSKPFGVLNIFELDKIPFTVKRIFSVTSSKNITRGFHAHHNCKQLLVCISGKIEIVTDDSKNKKKYVLEPNGKSVFINNKVWAEQKYLENNSVLLTFCDLEYDETDYIRDYKDFLNIIK